MNQKIFVLAIGIGAYAELPVLTCPPHDAADFATVVHSGVTPSEIKLLTDSDATRQSILKSLSWLADSSRPSDTSILFFSGHGWHPNAGTRTFLCPVDAAVTRLETTCLSSEELARKLRAIKSRRLVVFLDACYSGGIESPNAIIEGDGRIMLAASRPDTPALESAAMRNGIFTTYLLEALRGAVAQADGGVWASDVFSFVAHRMRRHHSQSIYQRAVGKDFVILSHERQSVVPVPLIANSTIDQRALRVAMLCVYDRVELSRLCGDLGLKIDDLPGRTLENQILYLIDFCSRHGFLDRLGDFVQSDHPELFASLDTSQPQPAGNYRL